MVSNCKKCRRVLPTSEVAAYRVICEDCWADKFKTPTYLILYEEERSSKRASRASVRSPEEKTPFLYRAW